MWTEILRLAHLGVLRHTTQYWWYFCIRELWCVLLSVQLNYSIWLYAGIHSCERKHIPAPQCRLLQLEVYFYMNGMFILYVGTCSFNHKNAYTLLHPGASSYKCMHVDAQSQVYPHKAVFCNSFVQVPVHNTCGSQAPNYRIWLCIGRYKATGMLNKMRLTYSLRRQRPRSHKKPMFWDLAGSISQGFSCLISFNYNTTMKATS